LVFWWYVPTFVAKYYEELFDLENQASLVIERNPPLRLQPMKREALKKPQLMNAGLVFVHLVSASENQHIAYSRYNRGLSLLAKNDIFGQFEANALVEFYEAFRSALSAYGDWDGNPETFTTAVGT